MNTQPSRIILDTDAFSFLHEGKPQASGYGPVLRGAIPCVAFVTVGELLFGAKSAGWGAPRLGRLQNAIRRCVVLPFNVQLAELWADVKVDAKKNGLPLAHREHSNDLWIAACGLFYQAPVLTGNVKHFRDVTGLSTLDGSGKS